jgi:hypothetical protein
VEGAMKELYLLTPVITQISDEDFFFLCGFYFRLDDCGYLVCSSVGPYHNKRLHQLVADRMGIVLKPGEMIDHKDTNIYNNQRTNLRAATNQQNQANSKLNVLNTTNHKGVYFDKKNNRYYAQITINGRNKHLHFGTFEECVKIREEAGKKRDGEFYNPG